VCTPIWPGPSNWVLTWPSSVVTYSSWKTVPSVPNGPPLGVPGMVSFQLRAATNGMSEA
jgi:predicted secreted protein